MPSLFLIEQSAIAEGGHYHAYTSTVAEAARRIGLDVTILINKRFVGAWSVEGATVIPAFQHTWGEAERLWITNWEPGNIAYDFAHAVRRTPPRAGDHVLFATLGYAEMTALLNYIVRLPITHKLPFFHILLRYDPQVLRENIGGFRPKFDRVAASAQLRRTVLFHADTDLLSAEFSELTGLPFTTLPIPFRQDHLVAELSRRIPRTEPLTITYLGDARLEKNFNALPAAIDELWSGYVASGRVRFVLQSNFNVEGGEPGMLRAVQLCGQYPSGGVELIHRPMDNAEYSARLAAADVVVIPYDADRYRVRSSGILIEAMAAGKPVVTTAGSWMATQVSPDHAVLVEDLTELGSALKTLIDGYPAFKEGAARIAPRLLEWSSGENFVRSLLATAPIRPTAAAPHILFVADGDTLVQRNGAGLTSLTQLRYLHDAGYAVCGVFLMNKRDFEIAQVENWTDQLRDRLSEFDLDAAFLAGRGRLSFDTLRQRQHRVSQEHTIAGDLEQVRAFDVPLELVDHLRRNRPDAIWLNYVTNAPLLNLLGLEGVPVLCETHDIQSFQKAIYGGRRVDDQELGEELGLLDRYAHLVSVSAAETAYLHHANPEARITTTGIFPPASGLPIAHLAGTTTIAEVVASCLPELFSADIGEEGDDWPADFRKLEDWQSIDLVYVSSSHVANVSGLRWFLDEVYLPLLAPFGVSMAVAGSIREAGDWPDCERLAFIGRVKHLAPLYSAARIVVLPILEGAGVAVKTAEALSFGRPIVATPLAMRGLEGEIGGVMVARTAREFNRAIGALISSSTVRAAQARAARETASRLADPAQYAEILNGAFADILGKRALPVHREPIRPDSVAHETEWGDELIYINRVVRDWLDEKPLESDLLSKLAAFHPEHLRVLLRTVLDALLVDRSALILQASGKLRHKALVRGCTSAKEALEFLTTAVCFLREVHANSRAVNPQLLYDVDVPLDVWTFDEKAFPSGTALQRTELERVGPYLEPVVRRTAAWKTATPRLAISCLRLEQTGAQRIISQEVPLSNTQRPKPLGEIRLPILRSSHGAARWLDLVVAGESNQAIAVLVDGQTAVCRAIQQSGFNIIRIDLPDHTPYHDYLSSTVAITAGPSCPIVVGAYVRIVYARRPEDVLNEAISRAPSSFLGAQFMESNVRGVDINREARALRDILSALQLGRPFLLASADTLRHKLDENLTTTDITSNIDVDSKLAEMLLDVLPLLKPLEVLNEAHSRNELVLVASWGLPLQLEVTFADETDGGPWTCFINDKSPKLISSDKTVQRWFSPAEDHKPPQMWRRSVVFRNTAGSLTRPREIRVICHIAFRELEKLGPVIKISNFHPLDNASGEVRWAWSSDQPWATIMLPLALLGAGTMQIRLVSLGDNTLHDDLRIILNGLELPFTIGRIDTDWEISAKFEPYNIATTELNVWVRHREKKGSDPRALGIAIRDIRFLMAMMIHV